MKKLLLLALCAILSANADARTLYVDAARPNNKGNGLSKARAKKTIQAAVNVAKKGDVILVCPGAYASFETNNRKISVKSVKGPAKTGVALQENRNFVAILGKTPGGDPWAVRGTATKLAGFTLDGGDVWCGGSGCCGVAGGTVSSCRIRNLAGMASACFRSKLVGCSILDNTYETSGTWGSRGMGGLVLDSVLNRCRVYDNIGNMGSFPDFGGGYKESYAVICGSTLVNCLVARNENESELFGETKAVNCTVAGNGIYHEPDRESRGGSVPRLSEGSSFVNCILRNNFSRTAGSADSGFESTGVRYGAKTVRNVDPGNVYANTNKTNRNPKFASGFKLKKGSFCIDRGKLTKAQKKLVGTKDLAGKKRIKGKAIDLGCFEY